MGDDPTRETLELTELVQVDEKDLAKAHETCLEQEKRAYKVSPNAYAHTKPIDGHKIDISKSTSAAKEPVRNISDDQAKEIARATVAGEVIDVSIERKLGKKRLVAEVIRSRDMAEVDVIIDMETGDVLAVDE